MSVHGPDGATSRKVEVKSARPIRRNRARLPRLVEVLSPGTRRTDHVTKLAEYAEAGIPRYAILDDGPPIVLTRFVLEGGRYRQEAEHRGRTVADLGVPVPLDLDAWAR